MHRPLITRLTLGLLATAAGGLTYAQTIYGASIEWAVVGYVLLAVGLCSLLSLTEGSEA